MTARIICGDCLDVLKTLPTESVNCCVTSPPYFGLRDYGVDGQIGLEPSPEEYVSQMVDVFKIMRPVLKDDATVWLNIGDSYFNHSPVRKSSSGAFEKEYTGGKISNGSKERRRANGHETLKMKDLIGIPWRVAFALQADGWYLRQDIIWHKPNPMPESVRDRCTKAHEYLFLLSKAPRYYYDADAIKEEAIGKNPHDLTGPGYHAPGQSPQTGLRRKTEDLTWATDGRRNRRDVWTVATKPYPEAHFATFPPDLIRPCVRAGCPVGGTVLDPFAGAGTTGLVALEEGRDFIGIELNPEYVGLIEKRLAPLLAVRTLDCFFEEGAEA